VSEAELLSPTLFFTIGGPAVDRLRKAQL